MKILVTGARGFLGGAVGGCASQLGWEVLGIGRGSQAPPGWKGSYRWADVAQSDLSTVISAFQPDMIFHGAGSASVQNSFESPFDDFRASVLTFASVLDAVRRSTVKPLVVFPSSAAVYGNQSVSPIRETAPLAPVSPYGFHKQQCELLATEFREGFGMRVIVCRVFSVFGAQQKRLLIWELFNQLASPSAEITLKGTGFETRDYLHVDDAASLILSIARTASGERHSDHTFNIASGTEISVNDIVSVLSEQLGVKKMIYRAESGRIGDPVRWQADMTAVKRLLDDWSPPCFSTRIQQVLNDWQ